MQLRFFTIPIHGGDEAAEELNRFLGANRVVAVERSFVQDGANSAWALCVSFETGPGRSQTGKRGKIDYRDVLNPQDFAVFAKLRSLRKELAERDGAPAYNVMTDEQMAELVKRRVQTVAALREVPGFGDARVEKYGEALLRQLRETLPASEPNPSEPTNEA